MMKKINFCNKVAYTILLLLILAVTPFVLPKVIGIEPYGILSNSMEPDYPVGSIVYVKSTQPENIVAGDVITFKQSVVSGSVATHRVVENKKTESTLVTKGDFNEAIDASPVAYERLIGKVIICIPKLGDFYLWLVSMWGVALCTFGILMVLVLWVYVYIQKKIISKDQKQN